MREELESAYRSLSFFQRFRFRGLLQQITSMIEPTEAIHAVSFGWWRGRRSITVVTVTRLLLARCSGDQPTVVRSVVFWRSISRMCVHRIPPHGARFRLLVGSYLEEFTVHTRAEEIDTALRAVVAPTALTPTTITSSPLPHPHHAPPVTLNNPTP